jgi:coiled-coil domain-containing protein 55
MKHIAEKNKNRKVKTTTESTEEMITDDKLVELAEKEGKDVMVNDNNEIVDKRQLLGAGLNIKPKFGTLGSLASSDDRIKERMNEYEEYKRKKVEEYDSKRKHGKNNDEREQKVTAKRTTEDVAMNAKDRYMARKKQKLEEEKQQKKK